MKMIECRTFFFFLKYFFEKTHNQQIRAEKPKIWVPMFFSWEIAAFFRDDFGDFLNQSGPNK